VLATIDVRESSADQVRGWLLHAQKNLQELFALKTVEEKAPDALVEILLQTLDDLFENVDLGIVATVRFLGFEILIENYASGLA
jgi:hypothetical protein